MESLREINASGIKTVVLQAGEDPGLDAVWVENIVKAIKSEFDMAVTLSLGERRKEDYQLWRDAGADRYLLKIETTDKIQYQRLHPGMSFENRLNCLKHLSSLGYQTGCGNIIGLKDQTLNSIAKDMIFFKKEGFDMIGIGPFIPHEQTKLAGERTGEVSLVLKVLALTRIITKYAHLPATTALGSIGKGDLRKDGLRAGANVLMLNFTPLGYRKLYEIYPNKRCVSEAGITLEGYFEKLAASAGRKLDYSRGDSLLVAH
jgi:biotin synthase